VVGVDPGHVSGGVVAPGLRPSDRVDRVSVWLGVGGFRAGFVGCFVPRRDRRRGSRLRGQPAGGWEGFELVERGREIGRPGPIALEAQPDAMAVEDEPAGDVQ
jgi:hypothetical protein